MPTNNDNQVLVDMTVAATLLRQVEKTPFVIVPQGMEAKSLESMMTRPTRIRADIKVFDTAGFIAYFNRFKAVGSAIYAKVEPARFYGVIDGNTEENAAWQDHTISYECPLSKEWKEWIKSSGSSKSQAAFSEFIENNMPDIVSTNANEPTGAEMLQIATSFQAKTSVNFASGTRLNNGQVELTYVEDIKGTAGPKGSIKVPERFFIAVPVFEGGAPYKVEAKFRYRIKDGVLTMWYDLIRPHKTHEAAHKDIWTEIAETTGVSIINGEVTK